MGFNCHNVSNHEIRFDTNISNWSFLLRLGTKFGWMPKGTEKPVDHKRKWSGSYGLNMGQVVSADDARAWGAAISKAIEENPEVNAITGERLLVSEAYEQRLRAFIAMCDAGPFEIW